MLELSGVHTYLGGSHILQGVSLRVQKGQVVALLGRNGVGKTTTIRSIMGLAPPAEGSILFKGEKIDGLKPHRIAQRGIGLVPQGRRVFPSLTIRETLALALRNAAPRGAARTSLETIFSRFPVLESLANRRGNQLSGGQQQILAVARGLASNPELLLMDEPSEGLAPIMVEKIEEIILHLKEQGLSILLVEQHLPLALKVADHAYVMVKGTIRCESTTQALARDEFVQTQYLGIPKRQDRP
ncbi:MAG: ABC transporter ATP-binding protein [Chloroflexi bacterium]|nr:ABC transporter ATP-binding protein [Chloroflexota bacterium]